MKVGYIQFDVKHDKNENFRCIEHYLENFDSELVVLPELCICGYLFPNKKALLDAAEKVPCGVSTLEMQKLSEKYQCIIVFGLAEKEGAHIYNTAVVVGYGKYMGKYRKVHLSDLEKTLFERGDRNPVIDTGRFKLGIQICFDLWFPEISREQVKQGADILCALANFGGETTAVIARTRAIENLTPLIMCNRIGTEQTTQIDAYFLGKSAILNAAGECVSACEADSEMMGSGVLKIGAQHSNVICRDFDAEISIHPLNTKEYETEKSAQVE